MKVGAAAVQLPVPDGTPLGGYADRTGTSAGQHDELQISCVLIDCDARAMALITADLVCVNFDLADTVSAAVAAQLPIEPSAVWMTATHTHSAPDVDCGTGPRRTPPAWLEAITGAAVRAAISAWESRDDAAVSLRRGELSNVGSVRADSSAPAVVPVDLISVENDDGLRGVLVVVPVHPTVLPAANVCVSADLAGAIRVHLAERLVAAGSNAWVVVATGCAGDISTRFTRHAQTYAEVHRLGDHAAAQLMTALRSEAESTVHGAAALHVGRRDLELPVRDDAPLADSALATRSDLSDRVFHTLRQGVAVAAARATRFPDNRVRLTVAAAQLGSIRLLGLSAEPYLAIRDLADAPAVVIGYANGYSGYLPDRDGFGQATYESVSSPFTRDAAETAVRTAEALLAKSDLEDRT